MHPSDGDLRAYQDRELSDSERSRIEEHLQLCARCTKRLRAAEERSAHLYRLFDSLTPQAGEVPIPALMARVRLHTRLAAEKEKTTMSKASSRFYLRRPAWALGILVLLVVAFTAFPPARTWAARFLQFFRVQQFAVVEFNPETLPAQLNGSEQFRRLLSNSIRAEAKGERQENVTLAQASLLSGLQVRTPLALESKAEISVEPRTVVTLTIDIDRIQSILTELGRPDIPLPTVADGETVTVDLPPSVRMLFGDCPKPDVQHLSDPDDPDSPRPDFGNCTMFLQTMTPTVSAPGGLDVGKIGEVLLQVLGMSPEEAQRFSQTIDWTSTFVIPIPRHQASYETVTVQGVKATFIAADQHRGGRGYFLVWVKDDVIYALSGPGGQTEALNIANSIG